MKYTKLKTTTKFHLKFRNYKYFFIQNTKDNLRSFKGLFEIIEELLYTEDNLFTLNKK